MKNPPRLLPGGAMIQHSNLGITGSEAVRVSTGRFRFSGRVRFAQNMQDRERDLRGVCVRGRWVLAVRRLRASHRCVWKQHRLKSEHVLDGALSPGAALLASCLMAASCLVIRQRWPFSLMVTFSFIARSQMLVVSP